MRTVPAAPPSSLVNFRREIETSTLATRMTKTTQSSDNLKRLTCKDDGMPHKRLSRMKKLLTTPMKYLNKSDPPVMHTMEHQGILQHDTNFNNKQKAKSESLIAAHIIRNPACCAQTVEKICSAIFEIINKIHSGPKGEYENKFISLFEAKASEEGAFGRVEHGIPEMLTVLKSGIDPISFTKKMEIIRAFGAFIFDHAVLEVENYGFLPVGEETKALITKHYPSHLLEHRGRSAIIRTEAREYRGIVDKNEFDLLSKEDQTKLTVPVLNNTRPVFRTFTHEIGEDGNRNIESRFVNRTFDNDLPLIATISGTTACILVCAYSLFETLTESEEKELAIAAVGKIVGGGYHSITEVLDIAYPGLDLVQALNL